MESGIGVSDRERALIIIWNRVVDAWSAQKFDEARTQEVLYTMVESMTDRTFQESVVYN